MSDRDKLKEKIAKAIGDEEGFGIARYHEAEAALTAIEEAGCVLIPREPTPEMMDAASWVGPGTYRHIYADIVETSPFQPSAEKSDD